MVYTPCKRGKRDHHLLRAPNEAESKKLTETLQILRIIAQSPFSNFTEKFEEISGRIPGQNKSPESRRIGRGSERYVGRLTRDDKFPEAGS
ncbi:hypothetical protein K0M31_001551 [Melipona bicolor]|uniref:Uncharacterized protein n=1 Tax=Melipona bicolor TaxID=60889 RepID=A0AA40GFR5_9HYME|nr:hypothetical protein K0M31_001551 [Melipona bicolor]